LEYIYQGKLPSEEDILKELLGYSEKILMKRLKFVCERGLLNKITKRNAVELYEISKISGAEDLREAVLQFMGQNLSYFADKLIMKDDGSKEVSRERSENSKEKKRVSQFQRFWKKLMTAL